MEAYTKAQKGAMRMLSSEPALLAKNDTKSTLANKNHTYNDKDERKHKHKETRRQGWL